MRSYVSCVQVSFWILLRRIKKYWPTNPLKALVARLTIFALEGVGIGITANYFYEFTIKFIENEPASFALEKQYEYLVLVINMMTDYTRLLVGLTAVLIYATVRASMGYVLKHKWMAYCKHRTTDTLTVAEKHAQTLSQWCGSFVHRLAYRAAFIVHKLMIVWITYIVYLAHNPIKPLGWTKLIAHTINPWAILTDLDQVTGLGIFISAAAILYSIATFSVGPTKKQLERVGDICEDEKKNLKEGSSKQLELPLQIPT